jgi:hypothetical protein
VLKFLQVVEIKGVAFPGVALDLATGFMVVPAIGKVAGSLEMADFGETTQQPLGIHSQQFYLIKARGIGDPAPLGKGKEFHVAGGVLAVAEAAGYSVGLELQSGDKLVDQGGFARPRDAGDHGEAILTGLAEGVYAFARFATEKEGVVAPAPQSLSPEDNLFLADQINFVQTQANC